MKMLFKIIGALALAAILAGGGWFLYQALAPRLAVEDALPSGVLAYARLDDPLAYWQGLERSDFFKSLASIDVADVLRHNKVPPPQISRAVKSLAQVKAMLKNPLVATLLGKEIALAQYSLADSRVGLILAARLKASLQAAADFSLLFKDWGEGIAIRKETLEGEVIVHVTFKRRDLSFKYVHLRDLLFFTDEDSPLAGLVVQTFHRQHPSLKTDGRYRAVASRFYPQARGVLYVNLAGMTAPPGQEWAGVLARQTGLEGLGASFLSRPVTKFKFALTVDPTRADPRLEQFIACAPAKNGSLGLVPASAIAYHWGGCYVFKDMAVQLRAVLDTLLQDQPKKIRRSLEKKLSSRQMEDFISTLGPQAGGYITDVDTRGLVPYPRMLLFARLNDPSKARALLDGFLARGSWLNMLATEAYHGTNIHYVTLPIGGNIDPGFVLQGEYLLLASSRQLLKRSMDTFRDPSSSLAGDKNFESFGLLEGGKPSALVYVNIKEMAARMVDVLDWYQRYLFHQVELAAAYKKEAEDKKKELLKDTQAQEEQVRLASIKLKEWAAKPVEGLTADEIDNNARTVRNFEEQIRGARDAIKENQDGIAQINAVVAKNAAQAGKYRGIIYNSSHVLVPLCKGLQSFNTQALSVAGRGDALVAELMLN